VIDFVNWMFTDVLQYVLFTPFEIFKNPAVTSALLKMSLVSASLVTILAMLEGIKRSFSMKYTPMSQIAARYPVALGVSAFAPYLFYYGAIGANTVTGMMGKLTGSTMDGRDLYMNNMHGLGDHVYMSLLTFIFMIALFVYLFKIILFHATRWFGLLFNMITTPLAMLSYMFKPYEHVASAWVKDTLAKFGVQIAHSFMLGIIAIILYSPNMLPFSGFTTGVEWILVKLMLAIGGLHMMMNPPAWITGYLDKGADARKPIGTVVKLARLVLFKR
jgi:hypothetical protein